MGAPSGQGTSGGGQRLFISLPVPTPVRRRLAALQEEWSAAGLPFRWVRPEGLHLTLVFIGQRPEGDVPRLEGALARAVGGRGPLRLAVEGVGAFPGLERPRVLWAGLTGDLVALDGLRRAVGRELRAARVPFERQPFRPHVTLGRAKGPLAESGVATLREAGRREGGAPAFGAWTATDVHLMRSDVRPGGAVYTTLARAPLDGSEMGGAGAGVAAGAGSRREGVG
jgi:RNA 2',3'-cyclic 3'-phosphodiesterase